MGMLLKIQHELHYAQADFIHCKDLKEKANLWVAVCQTNGCCLVTSCMHWNRTRHPKYGVHLKGPL